MIYAKVRELVTSKLNVKFIEIQSIQHLGCFFFPLILLGKELITPTDFMLLGLWFPWDLM